MARAPAGNAKTQKDALHRRMTTVSSTSSFCRRRRRRLLGRAGLGNKIPPERIELSKNTPGENRTLNLLIRGQAPCPLGHGGIAYHVIETNQIMYGGRLTNGKT